MLVAILFCSVLKKKKCAGAHPLLLRSFESEFGNNLIVLIFIMLLQVFQMCAAIRNHLEKSAAGVIVLVILLQMRCELVDTLGKKTYLNGSRTGITLVQCGFLDDIRLFLFRKHGNIIAHTTKECKWDGFVLEYGEVFDMCLINP